MKRELRLASKTNANLMRANRGHRFAAGHALRIYGANAIYSFIPKNGCTSLRYALAIANGCLRPGDDPHWVDDNNSTFVAALPDLILADYTFVVLRCPFRRLASAFLDKMTEDTKRRDTFLKASGLTLETLTFRAFVASLDKPVMRRLDHHWAPQIDFLVYREYDDVFCLEQFDEMAARLKQRIGLEVPDTRSLVRHGLDQFERIEGAFADTAVPEIEALRAAGRSPDAASLYDADLIGQVETSYAKDFVIHRRWCPDAPRLFGA